MAAGVFVGHTYRRSRRAFPYPPPSRAHRRPFKAGTPGLSLICLSDGYPTAWPPTPPLPTAKILDRRIQNQRKWRSRFRIEELQQTGFGEPRADEGYSASDPLGTNCSTPQMPGQPT